MGDPQNVVTTQREDFDTCAVDVSWYHQSKTLKRNAITSTQAYYLHPEVYPVPDPGGLLNVSYTDVIKTKLLDGN